MVEEHYASSQTTEILENICITTTLSTFTPSLCSTHAWWHSLSFHALALFSPEKPCLRQCPRQACSRDEPAPACPYSLSFTRGEGSLLATPNLLLSCGLWSSPDTLVKCSRKSNSWFPSVAFQTNGLKFFHFSCPGT